MARAQLAPTVRSNMATAAHATVRLAYIDTLRILVITMVIAHHAGQPYGPTGGEWPIANPTRAAILEPFFTVNAAFGLGLLFLIAGYFTPRAYDRKGPRRFLGDRLIRLGVPLLVVSLVLMPPLVYAASAQDQPFSSFLLTYLRQPAVAHMWFVAYLIIYSCGYIGWRWFTRRAPPTPSQLSTPPHHPVILGYALGLALVTFLVRIWFPIDHWIEVAPFTRVELAHTPQYLSLFIIGIVAYRRDWLQRMPTKTGMVWLRIGLVAAALVYAAAILRERTPIDLDLSVDGGVSLGALMSSGIEALIAVGLSVGLLTLFREHVQRQGLMVQELATLSYAVYIIHIFPVIGVQLMLAGSRLAPLAKFGLVTLLAVPLCFALAYGLRQLPGVKRVV